MRRTIRLTERDLTNIVNRVIDESEDPNTLEGLTACTSKNSGKFAVIKGQKVLMGKRMDGSYGTVCIIK